VFAEIYKKQIPRKYDRVSTLKAAANAEALAATSDSETAYTADGTYVLVATTSNGVFIAEGFTEPEARKLQVMFLAARTAGAVEARNSAPAMPDLGSGLRGFLANAGTMRFALPQKQ
jgi:lipoprotein-anchoring transpeptidase ErfK/SrfK